jgi:hypothetical protein
LWVVGDEKSGESSAAWDGGIGWSIAFVALLLRRLESQFRPRIWPTCTSGRFSGFGWILKIFHRVLAARAILTAGWWLNASRCPVD